jgi:hypothetical protein
MSSLSAEKIAANRSLISELIRLHEEAHAWGNINGLPIPEKYPQFNRIREIGNNLYEINGLMQMEAAAQALEIQSMRYGGTGFNILVGNAWRGIGEWQK